MSPTTPTSLKDTLPSTSTTSTTPTTPQKPTTQTATQSPNHINLTYHTGDIFAAPPNTLLIHACNTQGTWGAGIAAAFRSRYPSAYARYRAHCLRTHNPATNPVPPGSCLLIPPCETDSRRPRHWIGCLFTSAGYGKARDPPEVILERTGPAMSECLREFKRRGEVRMCRVNSGKFGVEWERTVGVLGEVEVEGGAVVEVWSIE